MIIRNQSFDLHRETYIMGILNLTPDSFYDGNRHATFDKALVQAEKMIAEGADIIDVGGMSTRPGHEAIPPEEEIARVVPVIREIRARFSIPLSIDTYRSQVAEAALDAGADMVNDVWGLLHDEGQMAKTIARHNIPCCLMHNNTANVTSVEAVLTGLRHSVAHARACGIDPSNIILDPGIGFAKDPPLNLRVVKEIGSFAALDYPLLLGVSRKSLIGYALDLPVQERLEGSLAIAAYALQAAHIAFLRVHDVKEHVRTVRMLQAIRAC